MITEEQVESALDYLRNSAEPASVARAQSRTLKKYVEVVEAEKVSLQAGSMTHAQALMLARATPEYRQALDAWQKSVEEDCRFTMLREAADARIQAWRTEQATNRSMERIR